MEVNTYIDYYPGGALMPNRYASSAEYRYGFNGKEKDDEVKGITGSSYDFGARIYDPRIGRFLSMDPLASKYPAISPYVFVANNPIFFIDPDGRELKPASSREIGIFNNAISSFTGGNLNQAKRLFGLTELNRSFDNGLDQLTFSTSGGNFERRLGRLDLNDTQKAEAKAVFKLLNASEITEFRVETNSNAQTENIKQGEANTDPNGQLVVTQNTTLENIEKSGTISDFMNVNGTPLSVQGSKAAFFNNQIPRGQSTGIGANSLLSGQLFIDLTG